MRREEIWEKVKLPSAEGDSQEPGTMWIRNTRSGARLVRDKTGSVGIEKPMGNGRLTSRLRLLRNDLVN